MWHSFSVRNIVQSWPTPPSRTTGSWSRPSTRRKGAGGPRYEASEYAYNNERANLPKLVVTYGRPGVAVDPPTTITSTGAALSWPAYVDPSRLPGLTTSSSTRFTAASTRRFTPSAATLVAPVASRRRRYQDTTAKPTPADATDPFGQLLLLHGRGQDRRRAGHRRPDPGRPAAQGGPDHQPETSGRTGPDTTLSAAQPTTNVNVLRRRAHGCRSATTPHLTATPAAWSSSPTWPAIPAGARVVDAELRMWNTYVYPGTTGGGIYDVARADPRPSTRPPPRGTEANSTTNWTTPGGDFDPAAADTVTGITNDPEWQALERHQRPCRAWLTTPSSNYGLLVKLRDEPRRPTSGRSVLVQRGAEPHAAPDAGRSPTWSRRRSRPTTRRPPRR